MFRNTSVSEMLLTAPVNLKIWCAGTISHGEEATLPTTESNDKKLPHQEDHDICRHSANKMHVLYLFGGQTGLFGTEYETTDRRNLEASAVRGSKSKEDTA